jgi:APA family basic amino acid/polyamine antiporter
LLREIPALSLAPANNKKLIRGIGIYGSAFLALNGMIGAGIFALPAAVAAQAGVWSPWLFLGVGLLIITVVLTFAELSSYFRISGGPVLYATRAFGSLVGFSTGWIYYVSRAAAVAANSNAMAIYIAAIWPWFGSTAGHAAVVLVVCGGLTLINVLGVKDSVRTLALFTFFKLIPLLIMIVIGLQYVSPELLFPENMPTIEDLGGTTLLLIYAFVGFEQVLITAGETARPKVTIPKALILTMIATGLLYFLIVLVFVAVLGGDVDKTATLVDVGRKLAGPVGAFAITAAAIFSIGGNLAGTMLAVPRATFSLAEHRLLPQWFGQIHEKFSTPANSVVFLGVLAAALGLSGSFVFLATASSLTRLITYIVCIAALPVIKGNADTATIARAFRIPGGYTVPVVALILCLWVARHSEAKSWELTGALLIIGLALYGLEQLRVKKQRAA